MPKCQNTKCNKEFPSMWTNPETGKRHNLQNRKFCMECSPFGKHNTRDIMKESTHHLLTEKMCSCCGILSPVSEFYIIRPKRGTPRLSSLCKPCANKQAVDRFILSKQAAVGYLGGKCFKCSYQEYYGALEFHHKDPSQKDFTLGGSNKSLDQLKPELDKCILLCANCHRELHGGLWVLSS